jgi:putative hydrolase of the HAD superfamily
VNDNNANTDRKYKCIFFDLDHTLWDYETNSGETLVELYHGYGLSDKGVPDADAFVAQFNVVNEALWDQFDRGLIHSDVIRNERFNRVLSPFGIYDKTVAANIAADYLHLCPKKANLMPHALAVLDYLSGRYKLSIITNGFEEVQHQKLSSGKLTGYFENIITSQRAGHKKPAREIFQLALRSSAVDSHEAVMIGDNLITDIGGARNASITAIFYNTINKKHTAQPDIEITSLDELPRIL